MRDRQRIRFCTTSDGVRLAYATVGNGPPLVKAPNWLTHLEYEWESPLWRHWMEGLSRHHKLIRYDTRGCGLSDRDPAEISFESWVRDLEAVVDAMHLTRFPLLGISQGAAIAVEYAFRHPERVSHLVLYGGCAIASMKTGDTAAIERGRAQCKLIELGWGTPNAAFRRVFAHLFLPSGPSELWDALDALQRHASNARDAVRIREAAMHIDVVAQARAIRCPTLVLHARSDAAVAFDGGRMLASLIPGARLVPLESQHHILLEHEPAWARFLDEVEAFLSPRSAPAFADLTSRETELLEHLARGLDNHQIAAHLGLSEKTVRNMVSCVLDKLEVENRAQAIVKAREAGYGVSSTA